jgi:hypothetical protein
MHHRLELRQPDCVEMKEGYLTDVSGIKETGIVMDAAYCGDIRVKKETVLFDWPVGQRLTTMELDS